MTFVVVVVDVAACFTRFNNAPEGVNYRLHEKYKQRLTSPPAEGTLLYLSPSGKKNAS